MTRLEELTLKSADGCLDSREGAELDALLAADSKNRAVHIQLLRIEGLLRGRGSNANLVLLTLEQIRRENRQTVRVRVMETIRAAAPEIANAARPKFHKFVRATVPLALAASLTFLAALLIWYLTARTGSPVIAQVAGGAIIERGGQLLSARNGVHLQFGDVLRTQTNGSVEITFPPEKTTFNLSSSTILRLVTISRGKRFQLQTGTLEATVARQPPFHPLILQTAQGQARVLGTRFTLTATDLGTRLEVREGIVNLTRQFDGSSTRVSAGQFAVLASKHELAPLPLTGRVLREYWTNQPGSYFTGAI